MKVLHVIDALGLGGGAEQALLAQLPGLRDLGVDSEVVTLYPREVGLFERLQMLGFRYRVLDGKGWPARVRELRSVIRSSRPDLVHSTLFNACMASRLALIGSRQPHLDSLVNTTYDPARADLDGISPWKLDVTRRIDGAAARHLGGHFHVLTEAVATEAVDRLGIDRSRITVIPRGRDPLLLPHLGSEQRRDVRRSLGLVDSDVVAIAVGRQDLQKRHVDLLRAAATARGTVAALHVLLVGREGPATPTIQAAFNEVEGEGWVHSLGHRSDATTLIAAADMLVLPSAYEGLGSVLAEAMALRTPIIGSDAPAIAEVLQRGRLGLVVPRGDVARLSDAMVELVSRPDEAQARVDRAADHFERNYELDVVVSKTEQLYRTLVG